MAESFSASIKIFNYL